MIFDMDDRRRPVVASFWDYGYDRRGDRKYIVIIDADGANVIECADTPGNQLVHLQCPPGGPCQVHRGSPPGWTWRTGGNHG